MNRLERLLRELVDAIERHGHRAALVGGLAVSARAEPRLTRDVDLAIAVASDEEAEALVRALLGEGFTAADVVEQDVAERLATIRMGAPRETARGIVGDLLFASSGIETTIVDEAESLEVFPGLVVRVARAGHLIALKLLSRDDHARPQDRIDLNALRRVLDEQERERALAAIDLITTRGYARGRDLRAAFDEWWRDSAD